MKVVGEADVREALAFELDELVDHVCDNPKSLEDILVHGFRAITLAVLFVNNVDEITY